MSPLCPIRYSARNPTWCVPQACSQRLYPAPARARRNRPPSSGPPPRRCPVSMLAASPVSSTDACYKPVPSACTSPSPDARRSRLFAGTQRDARRESAIRHRRSASAFYESVVRRAAQPDAHHNCSPPSSSSSTVSPPAGTQRDARRNRPLDARPAPVVRRPVPSQPPGYAPPRRLSLAPPGLTARRPPRRSPAPPARPARSTRGVYVHAARSHAELAPRPPILACVESAPCVCMCPGPPAAALVSGVPSASAIHRADVARARNDTPARIFFRRCSHIAAAPCAKPES